MCIYGAFFKDQTLTFDVCILNFNAYNASFHMSNTCCKIFLNLSIQENVTARTRPPIFYSVLICSVPLWIKTQCDLDLRGRDTGLACDRLSWFVQYIGQVILKSIHTRESNQRGHEKLSWTHRCQKPNAIVFILYEKGYHTILLECIFTSFNKDNSLKSYVKVYVNEISLNLRNGLLLIVAIIEHF